MKMTSTKLYKDHIRLFVWAYVRQKQTPAETLQHLGPLILDFEQQRDGLKITEGEIRRMHRQALEDLDAAENRAADCICVGHPWGKAEEAAQKREAAETAAVAAGRGTLRQPIDLTQTPRDRKWYEIEGDTSEAKPRRKRRSAKV
jgi:hypothetical protein